MVHTYNISGMTCSSCEAKVKKALLSIAGIHAVEVSKDQGTATVTMNGHIPMHQLQAALEDRYQISMAQPQQPEEATRSWFSTYKPVLLIFCYLLGITLLLEWTAPYADLQRAMRHFMAGFFLTFSFFKMLNLNGFKDSYAMYDIIARKFPVWGYLYAFTELLLGIAFLANLNPIITNGVTLVVMGLSIIGVLQTVLNKKSIQCACLGDVFKLPMSTVTIIEDGLMILMSLAMLWMAL